MKTSYTKFIVSLVVFSAVTLSLTAQEYTTYIRNVDVTPFTKVEVSLDTEVILLQSTRNTITLAGDSTFIYKTPVSVENGTLVLNYQQEPENKLYRIIIEYTDLDRLVAGGNGSYFLHKLDTDNLVVFNPAAQVYVSGEIEKLRLVSNEGFNDISKLRAANKFLHIGEYATLVNAADDADLFVAKSND